MATIEPGSHTPALHSHQSSTTSAIWLSIAGAWRRLAQRHAQALRNRRDMEALQQLDDHQLKDIGLTHGQIESFVIDRSWHIASTRPMASPFRVCDAQA
jgi:uncharacterized protein YjiS (DUF1127 family)